MSRVTMSLDEAQNCDVVSIALQGIEVIILRNGKPEGRLISIHEQKGRRIAGLNRGSVWTSNDYDEPLPDKF